MFSPIVLDFLLKDVPEKIRRQVSDSYLEIRNWLNSPDNERYKNIQPCIQIITQWIRAITIGFL